MSRNSEKARTVLFRYQEQQAELGGYVDYNSTQRPRSIKTVTSLKDAEAWRKQVLQEINQKVNRLNDSKVSDFQLRDLNDDVNKLVREKLAWEYHIKALGGPDYIQSSQGKITGGVVIRGYRYFGRAKELSGVKEILQKQQQLEDEKKFKQGAKVSQQQKLKDLEARVGVDYYGFRDEVTQLNQRDVHGDVLQSAKDVLGDLIQDEDTGSTDETQQLQDELLKSERSATKKRSKKMMQIRSVSPVLLIDDGAPPSLQEVEAFLVQRRKKQLEVQFDM